MTLDPAVIEEARRWVAESDGENLDPEDRFAVALVALADGREKVLEWCDEKEGGAVSELAALESLGANTQHALSPFWKTEISTARQVRSILGDKP